MSDKAMRLRVPDRRCTFALGGDDILGRCSTENDGGGLSQFAEALTRHGKMGISDQIKIKQTRSLKVRHSPAFSFQKLELAK
jgi:hypothetical protein